MSTLTIGLIREGKIPQDNRVALTPSQCKELQDQSEGLKIIAEPSEIRCFPDDEYRQYEVEVAEKTDQCDLLIGIKEIPVNHLVGEKTYMFFSHTVKMQAYNRNLLRTIIQKRIRLIDFELLTDDAGKRLIGFGFYAGVVGAHYAMLCYGRKSGNYHIEPAHVMEDYNALIKAYNGINFKPFRIVIAGNGNVANGARDLLLKTGIKEVSPEEYLRHNFEDPVFTQLLSRHLYSTKDGRPFNKEYFKQRPQEHESLIHKYTSHTDVLINAVYWDTGIPRHFEVEDTAEDDFRIKVISDVSCDIRGSVPLTVKHSYKDSPFYGYDPEKQELTEPFLENTIDIMAIGNLPNELPKDASRDFGQIMKNVIIPAYMEDPDQPMFERATITNNRQLTTPFQYLDSFVKQSSTDQNE